MQAAHRIHELLAEHTDTADTTTFTCQPKAFFGFFPVAAAAYVAGLVVCVAAPSSVIATVCTTCLSVVSMAMVLSQFVFYRTHFDRFYATKTGVNVHATVEPTGQVMRQIVFSGHHDSAFIFNYLNRWQQLYGVRIVGAFVFCIISFLLTIALAVCAVTGVQLPVRGLIIGLWVVGLVFVLPAVRFTANRGTVGAGDNLISCAILIELAKHFAMPTNRPESTRIIFASFDAEECGLRGSSAWVAAHNDLLTEAPTTVINMDSIWQPEDLQVMVSDVNGTVALSDEVGTQLIGVAKAIGIPYAKFHMIFGGGGTDAASFARVSIPAVTILGMPTTMVRSDLVYHTDQDTVDTINPKAVAAVLQTCVAFVEVHGCGEAVVKQVAEIAGVGRKG